jgi:hypothetical protein
MRMKRAGKILISVLALVASQAALAGPLVVSNVSIVDDAGVRVVVGTAVNQSDQNLPFASVQFKVYDAQNAVLGNALANQQNLGPHETWNFKAYSTAQNFDHATLSSVTPP